MQQLKSKKKIRKELKQTILLTNIRDVIAKILMIMKNHIGEENKISRVTLFVKVYGIQPEDVSEIKEWFLWELIKRAMHRCRQRTKCFIVSNRYSVSSYGVGSIWHYWVANRMSDYLIYRDNINRNIRAMRRMTEKCNKSINQKWWKEDWSYK